jgi:hypothetical protein
MLQVMPLLQLQPQPPLLPPLQLPLLLLRQLRLQKSIPVIRLGC